MAAVHERGAVAELLRGGLRPRIERRCGTEAQRAEALAAIKSAADVLGPLAARCGTDLDRFLDELALGAEVDTWDPRADRISLLTLHAAKGLEFPVVFIAGCDDGLLPLRSWRGAEVDYAEERRLLFVGMTRATTRLTLLTAAKRTLRGEVTGVLAVAVPRLGRPGAARPARRRGRGPRPPQAARPAGGPVLVFLPDARRPVPGPGARGRAAGLLRLGEVVDRDAADGLRLEVGGHPGGDRRGAVAAAEAVAARPHVVVDLALSDQRLELGQGG